MEGIQLKLATKRRITTLLIAALAVWPAVHYVLVQKFELSPWRYFGWAMYCVPALSPDVTIYLVRDSGRELFESSPDSEISEIVWRFEKDRQQLGRLRKPDAIGRWILDRHSDVRAVEVEVEERSLDTTTARIVARSETFAYRR